MHLYLQETRPGGSWNFFPNLCDFFNLGQAVLYLKTPDGQYLKPETQSQPTAPSAPVLELTVPLNFRLASGIPQVLTGTERNPLGDYSQGFRKDTTPPVALPLVRDGDLRGTLILLNPPLMDLEDPDFLLLWEGVKQFFLELLAPDLPPGVLHWTEDNLLKIRQRLEAQRLGVGLWVLPWEDLQHQGLPVLTQWELQHQALKVLSELTGPLGGVLHRTHQSCGVFGLNPRVPKDLLAHQIQLALPPELKNPGSFVQELRP